eukprot:gene34758-44951_t
MLLWWIFAGLGYTRAVWSAACSACPPGKYSSRDHTICETCSAGTYSSNQGDSQGQCAKCAPGKYAAADHLSCEPCLAGSHCDSSDSCQVRCNLCDESTISCAGDGCLTLFSCPYSGKLRVPKAIVNARTNTGSYSCLNHVTHSSHTIDYSYYEAHHCPDMDHVTHYNPFYPDQSANFCSDPKSFTRTDHVTHCDSNGFTYVYL